MKKATAASALKVQAVLGDGFEVVEFDESTATSQEAADAIGCTVSEIAKSLIFCGKDSETPVLVVASGTNRVDEKKVRDLIGEKVKRPDADYVRRVTGFVIGGTPPVAHATPMRVLLDEDLKQYASLWASGGTPKAVFNLTPDDLERLTGGTYCDVAKR